MSVGAVHLVIWEGKFDSLVGGSMMEGILGNLINEVKITHSYLTHWLPHGSSISPSEPPTPLLPSPSSETQVLLWLQWNSNFKLHRWKIATHWHEGISGTILERELRMTEVSSFGNVHWGIALPCPVLRVTWIGGKAVLSSQLLRGGTLFSWLLPRRVASACSGKRNGQELEPAEDVFSRPQVQPCFWERVQGNLKADWVAVGAGDWD